MNNVIISILIIILSIISIFYGVATMSLEDLFVQGSNSNTIFLLSRIPRTISIVTAGFGMSICGLIMQQLTMNKFVSPTTAGTADSSKLGILVALLFFPKESIIFKMLIATIFAIGGTFLFLGIVRKINVKDNALVPLIGIMISGILSSLTMFFAYKGDLIQSINSWLFGDFSGVLKGNYELLYLTIPLVILAFVYSKHFTISGMGEEFAVNLGLNYKMIVNLGLILVCIISSLVMITIGGIPFLGLIIPNIVSMYRGDNLSKSIYTTGALGSFFLLACDILGRWVIYPHEIPIGLITGILGSGIFLGMIFRRLNFES
ncbi:MULTISPECIES: ABC transporter permease [Cetobacterium]|uniref:Iron chelate uptake ABC transporter family permease subunit n=1 Tax=Candidatus Cetobacterium colombiensis TaxID=3073100 RepID=A0ABU4W945_9FUSO|nr:iron chelate uptake ABC transporter family permease subunit [Candidatus Cetobacterium colombiensis]MDX8336031.1 iron chelate uptake ABC transporter family permease subunit [Candidatus Cetobacterium colombiensis]